MINPTQERVSAHGAYALKKRSEGLQFEKIGTNRVLKCVQHAMKVFIFHAIKKYPFCTSPVLRRDICTVSQIVKFIQ